MILNINLIPEGHSVVTHTINNSNEYPDLPQIPAGIICQCNIDRKGKDLAVDVEYAGAIELSCARCLEQFSRQVKGHIYVILEFSQDAKDFDDEHSVFYYNDQSP